MHMHVHKCECYVYVCMHVYDICGMYINVSAMCMYACIMHDMHDCNTTGRFGHLVAQPALRKCAEKWPKHVSLHAHSVN